LLANLLPDDLDKELERRWHRFVRYADDCNIYVKSLRAGNRVLASITRFLGRKLKLSVNHNKSAVDRPWKRTFLGFTFGKRKPNRRKVSVKAIKRFKARIRQITRRTRGHSLTNVIADLNSYITGWKGYFGLAEIYSPLKDLDKWVRRRLRCYLLKQWGKRGYKELRKRGIDTRLAWNTSKSAHGPWRLSGSPALSYALPNSFFRKMGLPSIVDVNRKLNQPNCHGT
jgi:RNA-directed DNA polymerase